MVICLHILRLNIISIHACNVFTDWKRECKNENTACKGNVFARSQTKHAENNLISIHACNVFTDWKLKQKLSSQYLVCAYTVLTWENCASVGSQNIGTWPITSWQMSLRENSAKYILAEYIAMFSKTCTILFENENTDSA